MRLSRETRRKPIASGFPYFETNPKNGKPKGNQKEAMILRRRAPLGAAACAAAGQGPESGSTTAGGDERPQEPRRRAGGAEFTKARAVAGVVVTGFGFARRLVTGFRCLPLSGVVSCFSPFFLLVFRLPLFPKE